MSDELARRKRAASERAVRAVRDGMVVGLGTGSTAEMAIQAIADRVRAGLDVVGVPTSLRSEALARSLGIPLKDIQDVERIDLTIDGADEVDPATLYVLKGRGGALLREKLVALASDRVIIVVDDSKIVDRLGTRSAVPVEVIPFGWRIPAAQLTRLGGTVVLRTVGETGEPFVTDNHHYILDVTFGPIDEPARLASEIKAIPGVVEHGLFIDLVDEVVVAGDGVQILERSRDRR